MSTRKLLIYAAVVVVAVVGWYLFRPERLFINVKVNEIGRASCRERV